MTLHGKTALVTGATGNGIGRAIATELSKQGANVLVTYARQKTALEEAALHEWLRSYPNITPFKVPEDNTGDQLSGYEDIVASHSIDILVNNAGQPWKEEDFAALDFSRLLSSLWVEFVVPVFLTRVVLPGMRANRFGRIINIGLHKEVFNILLTEQYEHPLCKYPFSFVLCKALRESLGTTIALSEFKFGITCNTIAPGIIEDSVENFMTAACKAYSPKDVAATVGFLCSEHAAGITGTTVMLPGNLFSRLSPQ